MIQIGKQQICDKNTEPDFDPARHGIIHPKQRCNIDKTSHTHQNQ